MRSRWKGPKIRDEPHAAASTGGIPKPSYLEGYIKAAVAVCGINTRKCQKRPSKEAKETWH
jgi:hypothetical protein